MSESRSTPFNVLILCTGNSARSILAEALVNKLGEGRFVGHSAGSFPKGEVHPQAIALLKSLGYATERFRSKSWDEFAAPGAAELDFVITVCDNAAGEICPIWPGRPITAHWGIPDPAAVDGSPSQIVLAFSEAYQSLERRISLFTSLPVASLDKITLKRRMDDIGLTEDAAEQA
ncbi:MAG TPA: arsenate reductase ArsC [Caulobacteraceae bacterium]|jgi:protein-tyrosine-phosphatase